MTQSEQQPQFPDRPTPIGEESSLEGFSLFSSGGYSMSSQLVHEHCHQRLNSSFVEPSSFLSTAGAKLIELRDRVGAKLAGARGSMSEIIALSDGIGTYRSLTYQKTRVGNGSLFMLSERRDCQILVNAADLLMERAEWDEALGGSEVGGIFGDAVRRLTDKFDVGAGREFMSLPLEGETELTFTVFKPKEGAELLPERVTFGMSGGDTLDFELDMNRGVVKVLLPDSADERGMHQVITSDITELDKVLCLNTLRELVEWGHGLLGQ